MKIAIIGDIHAIAPNDPHDLFHENRLFFKDAWPSFLALMTQIKAASPDLVISVGDLMDWYSDENRDLVVEQFNQLHCPWYFTPGNHDLEFPVYPFTRWALTRDKCEELTKIWEAAGFNLANQYIEAEDSGLFLINSALSKVADGTKEWLLERLPKNKRNFIFTHVPFANPPIREYILSVSPNRNMTKYVQSANPDFFDTEIQSQVSHVFNGHLHFTGTITTGPTQHHLVGTGITPVTKSKKPGRFHLLTLGKETSLETVLAE